MAADVGITADQRDSFATRYRRLWWTRGEENRGGRRVRIERGEQIMGRRRGGGGLQRT